MTVRHASSDNEVRPDVVQAAVAITAARRYVPNQICLTCMRHVYYEQHKDVGHDVVALTRAEGAAVLARHEAVNKAEWDATKRFRRI